MERRETVWFYSFSVKSGVLDQNMAVFIQGSTSESSMDGFEATWNLENSPPVPPVNSRFAAVCEGSNCVLSGGNGQIAGENYIQIAAKFHRFSY